jgi:hypothetical protein
LVKASAPKPQAKCSAQPAAAPAPVDRGVVLTMVREADGTLSWEWAPRTVDRTADLALASRYGLIYGTEEAS